MLITEKENGERWRVTWRVFAKHMPLKGLQALADAIVNHDVRLIQGATVLPRPHAQQIPRPIWKACAVGFCGWQGYDLATNQDVNEFFARVCLQVDEELETTGACRYFLNWFDIANKENLMEELLPEIYLELERRKMLP